MGYLLDRRGRGAADHLERSSPWIGTQLVPVHLDSLAQRRPNPLSA
jgi:hypothetical protein